MDRLWTRSVAIWASRGSACAAAFAITIRPRLSDGVDAVGEQRMRARPSLTRTSTRRRHALSGALLSGVLALGGCGSSLSPQPARTDATVSRSASTSLTTGQTRASRRQRSGAQRSGIVGQTVSSRCAGQASGDSGCQERPLRATIEVLRLPDRVRTANVATDSTGRFRLSVPPGSYELVPRTSGALLWARVEQTRVATHELTHVVVRFVPRHPLPMTPAA